MLINTLIWGNGLLLNINLFIFNWRIITLQHCVGFCHTLTQISHRYTYVPYLLSLPPTSHPIPPSRLSQSPRLSFLHHTANSHLLSSLLMLKLKLQYFSHLMWRDNSLEKTLMLGMIEGRRRKGRGRDSWMASPTQWTWVWASSRRWRTEKPGMRSQRVGHNWAIEQQQCSLHMIVYMFPCYSLHSSHPLLPHPVSKNNLSVFMSVFPLLPCK